MCGERAAQTQRGEPERQLGSYSGSSRLNCETVTMPLGTPPFLFWGGVWVFCFDLGFFTFYEPFPLERVGTYKAQK